jgi:hypothetical protein
MFNLGYKDVILNNLDGVTGDGINITIKGYGTFNKLDILAGGTAATAPEKEKAKWTTLPTVPAGVDGSFADVKIVLVKLKTDARETVHFYASDPAAADIVGGYNTWKKNHLEVAPKFTLAEGASSTELITEMLPGFEGWSIAQIFVRLGQETSIETARRERRLEKTLVTEGSEGTGQGWQIEASKKLGTFVNSFPYGQQHGGNSIGVDLKAGYKSYFITKAEPVNFDWEGPEFVDHKTVNATLGTKDFNFNIYVHEDFVTAFEAL